MIFEFIIMMIGKDSFLEMKFFGKDEDFACFELSNCTYHEFYSVSTFLLFEIFTRPLRSVFKLILARWRSRPIKLRLRERQPITARLEKISLKPHLSG